MSTRISLVKEQIEHLKKENSYTQKQQVGESAVVRQQTLDKTSSVLQNIPSKTMNQTNPIQGISPQPIAAPNTFLINSANHIQNYSTTLQNQYRIQNKSNQPLAAVPSNVVTAANGFNSTNNQPNSVTSYLANFSSNNSQGSPYSQPISYGQNSSSPLTLQESHNTLAKYSLQNQNNKNLNEHNLAYPNSNSAVQGTQSLNNQLQNYASSSQNGLTSGNSNNGQSNISNFQATQNQNYMSSSGNNNANNHTLGGLQNTSQLGTTQGNSSIGTAVPVNNIQGSPPSSSYQAINNMVGATAGNNSSNSFGHANQAQQQQQPQQKNSQLNQQQQHYNQNQNIGSSNSLNNASNYQSIIGSQSNIPPNNSGYSPINNQNSSSQNASNPNVNLNNNQGLGSNSTIKVKNLLRTSSDLKDKIFENKIEGERESMNYQQQPNQQSHQSQQLNQQQMQQLHQHQQGEKPTTLGQQIYETLMAQSLQFQQQSTPSSQQQTQQGSQTQGQTQQQQPSLQQQYYSQNASSNYQNSSSINSHNQINNIQSAYNSNNNKTQTNQNIEQGQSSINSARSSTQSYLQNIGSSANNASTSINSYSSQNGQTRNSGVRNHTLERTDNIRSGNLNAKVQNSFQFSKGNSGLNSSSGATSQSQSINQNSSGNNLFRKSLEYNQTSQLTGLTAQNAQGSHVQSATINLFGSPQLNSTQSNQNYSSQTNATRNSNLKTSNTPNTSQKEIPADLQTTTETRFVDFYNKTKSPRDQLQALSKQQNKEHYNITNYEALNQQNLQQQQNQQSAATQGQARMSSSQNNSQAQQANFSSIGFNKTIDPTQNIQGIAAQGIELGSRSLERKVQPASSKLTSSTNMMQKYIASINPKSSITNFLPSQQQQQQEVIQHQQNQHIAEQQTLAQKFANNLNNNSRTAHHHSTFSNTSKNAKSSRSNTPTKSSNNSNLMTPSPSFISQNIVTLSQQSSQQGNYGSQLSGQNKSQQEYNPPNSRNQQQKNSIVQSKTGEQKSISSERQLSFNKSSSQNSQASQIGNSSNSTNPMVGQIVAVNNNNSVAIDIASKQSPRSSSNITSQIHKHNLTSSPISSVIVNQASGTQNSFSSSSPKPYSTNNKDFSKISLRQEERPKMQAHGTISPSSEKINSTNNNNIINNNSIQEIKPVTSKVNTEAIMNFLESQNQRIAQSQIQNQIQEDKRSTSMNRMNNQAAPTGTNQNNSNILGYSSKNNNLFVSSDFESNHSFSYNYNTSSKSKSPANQQKPSQKPIDFAQINSSNIQSKSPQQSHLQAQNSTALSNTSQHKLLTLNTDEANNQMNTQTSVSSTKSKQLQSKLLLDHINQSPNIGQGSTKAANDEIFLNYSQINSQYYAAGAPSSSATQPQSQTRVSIAGNNNHIFGSPNSQNLSNKSIDKINTKKPTNSTMRLFSEKKNTQTFNTKSPKSTNNNSFLQSTQHQASAASSVTNDNSITHSSIKKFEVLEQHSVSSANNSSSPFTKKNIDEHSTPTTALPQFSAEGVSKSNSNVQFNEIPFYSTFSSNNYRSPSPSNTHFLEMVKIKDKMKKVLEAHNQKEKQLQNENLDLKNQILQLKQELSSQSSEITSLKTQIQSTNFVNSFNCNNGTLNGNNNQLQMSFQNLFMNSQEYSAQKAFPSPQPVENNQLFQSPLEISFQQHQ